MKPHLSYALVACAILGFARAASAADAPPTKAPYVPKAPPTDVILLDHTRVDTAFQTGVRNNFESNIHYKVVAGRRVAPGFVEIHTRDTDVFYIVDGSATFVTGGTAVDPKDAGPNEIHATSITGGTERHLEKGDVIIIPHGIPHQFTKVDGTFLYFVVKVTE
jgi:mannose-6-phosphate isomerase-like protein (cupin superfamily)